jgi:hypothetical protein
VVIPKLGQFPIALEPGEKVVLTARPEPGAIFGVLWAAPIMLTLAGLWSHTRSENPQWDWGLYAAVWLAAAAALWFWQRGAIVATSQRLVFRSSLGRTTQVRWQDVQTVTTRGTLRDRLTGYGPRQHALFFHTRAGAVVRFRRIPSLATVMEHCRPHLPPDAVVTL